MKFTHAIVLRIPGALKFDDKKTAAKTDLLLARSQQEDLSDTLKEAGVEVLELQLEEGVSIHSLYPDDVAVVINGTALITRPKKTVAKTNEILSILRELVWDVVEAPPQEHNKPVVLEGSDVFYTGKEIFVGIRKNGTNMEGALMVAKTFADISVVPIQISGTLPLKYYVSMAANEVLAVGKSKESQAILKKIERDSTFRYKVLTLETDEAVNCMNVNDHLIFRHDLNELKFRVLQSPTELWGVTANELIKVGAPLSRFCLLAQKIRTLK